MPDISQDLVDELVAHVIEAHPREACGVLVGPADECRFERVVRMANVANVADGDDRYAFDPVAQLALWLALEVAAERPWGVYPLPPHYEGLAVEGGRHHGRYADMHYLIVGAEQKVRIFQIIDGRVTEDPLLISAGGRVGLG